MPQKSIESLLEEKIGLSADAIGPETITKAVRARMRALGLSDSEAYLSLVKTSKQEWEGLIESVVVPETWFFRNRKSFTYLGRYVKREWLPEHTGDVLRVLSMASSTGEEPYSIAMVLLDAGLPKRRFCVVAADISQKALNKAKLGFYGPECFRGNHLSFRERYFEATSQGYQLDPSVMVAVDFIKGNVLDGQFLAGDTPYDIIFCRNLLIYLSPLARKRVMRVVDRLLGKTGIFFVGHAERPLITGSGLQLIRQHGVFAFSRAAGPQIPKDNAQSKVRVKFERRREDPDKSSTSPPSGRPKENSSAGHAPYPLRERRQPPTKEVKLLEQARKLADEGILDEARRLCEKCLDQNAVHVQAHYLKGLICLATDNEKEAEECLDKTLYLDPDHLDALNHLALIAEHRGDGDRAAQLRQRVKRIREREGAD